jgi:hypothetical protein
LRPKIARQIERRKNDILNKIVRPSVYELTSGNTASVGSMSRFHGANHRTGEAEMANDTEVDKLASGIADSIVELVERNDGPVTLAQVNGQVPGFAKEEPRGWSLAVGEAFIWDGMTEAGCAALWQVTHGHRVAVQFVSPLPYILDGCIAINETWVPIVLLPARAANLETPNWIVRGSQEYRDRCIAMGAAKRKVCRLLKPSPVRCTADSFAVA